MTTSRTIVITVPRGNGTLSFPLRRTETTSTGIISVKRPSLVNNIQIQSVKMDRINNSSTVENMLKSELSDTESEMEVTKPPRKRQRLDHLSHEQKMMRRKMKNRVAAQTARDRKKLQVDDMEHKLSKISNELKQSKKIMKDLIIKIDGLKKENQILKGQSNSCRCGNTVATNNITEYEIKEESDIIEQITVTDATSSSILFSNDEKLTEASVVDSEQVLAGVRIPVSIECAESSVEQSTINSGSYVMDSDPCCSVFTAQQPNFSQQQIQYQPISAPLTQVHKVSTSEIVKSFKRIQPKNIIEDIYKSNACTRNQVNPETTVTQFANEATTKRVTGIEDLLIVNTARPNSTTDSSLQMMEDFPSFDALLESNDKMSDHDYAVSRATDFTDAEKEFVNHLAEILQYDVECNPLAPEHSPVTEPVCVAQATSTNKITSNHVPTTPIINDTISFGGDENQTSCTKSKMLSSVSGFFIPQEMQATPESTMTKTMSSVSSDPGYESADSPVSVSSDSAIFDSYLDYSSIEELFPSFV